MKWSTIWLLWLRHAVFGKDEEARKLYSKTALLLTISVELKFEEEEAFETVADWEVADETAVGGKFWREFIWEEESWVGTLNS